jgi:hypothetical protein
MSIQSHGNTSFFTFWEWHGRHFVDIKFYFIREFQFKNIHLLFVIFYPEIFVDVFYSGIQDFFASNIKIPFPNEGFRANPHDGSRTILEKFAAFIVAQQSFILDKKDRIHFSVCFPFGGTIHVQNMGKFDFNLMAIGFINAPFHNEAIAIAETSDTEIHPGKSFYVIVYLLNGLFVCHGFFIGKECESRLRQPDSTRGRRCFLPCRLMAARGRRVAPFLPSSLPLCVMAAPASREGVLMARPHGQRLRRQPAARATWMERSAYFAQMFAHKQAHALDACPAIDPFRIIVCGRPQRDPDAQDVFAYESSSRRSKAGRKGGRAKGKARGAVSVGRFGLAAWVSNGGKMAGRRQVCARLLCQCGAWRKAKVQLW